MEARHENHADQLEKLLSSHLGMRTAVPDEVDAEVREMVILAQQLRSSPALIPDPAFAQRLERRILAHRVILRQTNKWQDRPHWLMHGIRVALVLLVPVLLLLCLLLSPIVNHQWIPSVCKLHNNSCIFTTSHHDKNPSTGTAVRNADKTSTQTKLVNPFSADGNNNGSSENQNNGFPNNNISTTSPNENNGSTQSSVNGSSEGQNPVNNQHPNNGNSGHSNNGNSGHQKQRK